MEKNKSKLCNKGIGKMKLNKSERNIQQFQLALDIKQNYETIALAAKSNYVKNKTQHSKTLNNFHKSHSKDINVEELFLKKNEHSNAVPIKRIGFNKLKELSLKESSEILLTLNSPKSGFKELLKENNIDNIMMEIIIAVLGKVSKATELVNLKSLINQIVSHTDFLNKHLQRYLISWIGPSLESIHNILLFLSKFQEFQPMNSSDILTCIIPILEATLDKFQRKKLTIPLTIKSNLKSLKEKKDIIIEQYDEKSREKMSFDERVHSEMPPEDYQTIPIFPSKEDFINKRPFLRPNIVHGSYLDTNHYLDVQFRLLREDYVRPLRENLECYKKILNNEKNVEKKIRVYNNVHVLCPFNTEGGIVHLISFDVKPFSKIHWEVSKRLLPGSLLCLSSDNFETMKFATVANRDPAKLKIGQLEVHFEKLDSNIFSISSSEVFVMVESEAYFEAFRHTLLALQQIKDSNLPLKEYIVHVKKKVDAPEYLNNTTLYNFHSTFKNISSGNEDLIPVLFTHRWPSEKELGLDHSQYSALQAALTNEFAIIQGPPGTGKTFIGLKIAKVLLENSKIWNNGNNCPILVVCYTNHALDQFLEGILNFETNIVRIGGRSTNERIKQLQLSQLRQIARSERKIPKHIYLLRKNIMEKIEEIEYYLKSCEISLEQSTYEILSLPLLQQFIERRHAQFILDGPSPSENPDCNISDWLDISNINYYDFDDDDNDKNYKDENMTSFREIINIEDEDDIEFELGLREIDKYEFKHIQHSSISRNKDLEDPYSFKTVKLRKKAEHKKRRYISKQLKHNDIMTTLEAKQIGNVWKLKMEDRWRLYRLWLAKYISNIMEVYSKFQKFYQEQLEKLQELRSAEDKFLLHQANIIGMTTTGAGKYREFLQDLQPKIVIVEEAAEVLEAHIVTSLAVNTQHLILIGDHQQLRPSPTVYELAIRYSLDISLFERMIKNGMACHQLVLQHRMRPCISRLLTPSIYPNLLNHPSVEKYENILGVGCNMFFISHCHQESDIVDTKSHSNLHEARFIIELCLFFKLQGYESSQITVLTTYSGQLFAIKKLMKTNQHLDGIRVTVVDNFQGEENDIILVSFVRSNYEGSIGFLKVSNRVCVALSRAKKGLYCIGNFSLLAEKSDLWKNITKELQQQNAIGTSLTLTCQNHPETTISVSTAEDFKKNAPEGGCTKPCDFRMECGHSCIKRCHPFDRDHTKIECKKPCNKVLCNLGHKCQKFCFEKCGNCMVLVNKLIPTCQHECLIPCYLEIEKFSCNQKCNKLLDCSHVCLKLCSQSCDPCKVKIEKIFDCGHKVKVNCHENNSNIICKKTCEKTLACGHKCNKHCGINPCPACETLINISLPCSHKIEIKCSEKSIKKFSCEQACEKMMECGHECKLICGHRETCKSCDEMCKKKLDCGHHCTLKCGETCPTMCNTCNLILKINKITDNYHRSNDLYFKFDNQIDDMEIDDFEIDDFFYEN